MNTLKPYQVQKLELETHRIKGEFRRLRMLIQGGDMRAIQELAQLKAKAQGFQSRLQEFMEKHANTQIYVYLFGYLTTIHALFNNYHNLANIKESRTSLPWKKEGSNKSQLTKNVSQKSLADSKVKNELKSNVFSVQKQNKQPNRSRSIKKSSKTMKDSKMEISGLVTITIGEEDFQQILKLKQSISR